MAKDDLLNATDLQSFNPNGNFSLGDLSDSSFNMHVDDNDINITPDDYKKVKNFLVEKLHFPSRTAEKITDAVKENIQSVPEEAANAAKDGRKYILGIIGASIMGYISNQYYKCTGKKTPEQIAAEKRKIEIQEAIRPLLVDLEKTVVELKEQTSQLQESIEKFIQSNDKREVYGKFTASANGSGPGGQSIV